MHPENPRSVVWTELTCPTLMLPMSVTPLSQHEKVWKNSPSPCVIPDQTESHSPWDQLEELQGGAGAGVPGPI